MNVKTIFFGSSNYCIPLLETLSKETDLLSIITHPDKRQGNKQTITPSATKQFAIENKILFFTPDGKDELLDFKSEISSLQPDIAVVADYGLLIPHEIFEIPKYKTANIHFSQLPKYRGASPVQYTILNGEKSAWITVQILEKDLDTGDILWQKEVPLMGNETTGELYPKLFEIASQYLVDVLRNYIDSKLIPKKQNEQDATYTRRLTREDGFIPFPVLENALQGSGKPQLTKDEWPHDSVQLESLSASKSIAVGIERALRAFTPWPGLWTQIELSNQLINQSTDKPIKIRLKILKAHIEPITHHPSPTTKLIPDIVQMEGKKPVSWKQFIEGHPVILL